MLRNWITGTMLLLALAPGAAFSAESSANSISETEHVQPMYPGRTGSYYDWGRGQNGWGYCYEWTYDGAVLNGGRPVANYLCESYRPSNYNWGRGMDGWGYCYQWTPYGVVLNDGRPVSNYSCENVAPSYYAFGRGQDGYTYCYQWTPNGLPLNQGRPVPNYLCR